VLSYCFLKNSVLLQTVALVAKIQNVIDKKNSEIALSC
jgi:hypothetical protein